MVKYKVDLYGQPKGGCRLTFAEQRADVLGVGLNNITMSGAVEAVETLIESGKPGYIVTPNPEIICFCRRDPRIMAAVNGASLVIPDGIGVIYALKILRRPIGGRVPGVELGENILPVAVQRGYRLFIFGGKPGVAEKAAQRLTEKYAGLQICGTADGYFSDDGAVSAQISAAAPDLLFVCLGAPQQELWMAAHVGRVNARLMIGLGGSVDIYAGEVNRAPKFWRKLNLEWFYRLLCQPRRIGRLISSLPSFLWAVCRQRRREKKQQRA